MITCFIVGAPRGIDNGIVSLLFTLKEEAISFMKMLTKRGPRTEPCGTPIVIGLMGDFNSLNETYCSLLVRYD
jgi:hypothetical protein